MSISIYLASKYHQTIKKTASPGHRLSLPVHLSRLFLMDFGRLG